MPRPPRALEEGRLYHVFNRVGGGAMPFADEGLASRFVRGAACEPADGTRFTEKGNWGTYFAFTPACLD